MKTLYSLISDLNYSTENYYYLVGSKYKGCRIDLPLLYFFERDVLLWALRSLNYLGIECKYLDDLEGNEKLKKLILRIAKGELRVWELIPILFSVDAECHYLMIARQINIKGFNEKIGHKLSTEFVNVLNDFCRIYNKLYRGKIKIVKRM